MKNARSKALKKVGQWAGNVSDIHSYHRSMADKGTQMIFRDSRGNQRTRGHVVTSTHPEGGIKHSYFKTRKAAREYNPNAD